MSDAPPNSGEAPEHSLIEDCKERLKDSVYGAGLAYPWWSLSWRRVARRRDIIPDWSRRHRAIFIHVPKNAGLSIGKGFGMGEIGHAPAFAYRAADPRFYDQAFCFAVVRNPWDRLVSAYHYLRHGTRYDVDVKWRERHLPRHLDFRSFVRSLESRAVRARIMAFPHFAPQWHFLADRHGDVIVDDLIRFERLHEGLTAAAARLGIRYRPQRTNASRHRPYPEYYDDATVALVGELYRRDVELFDYSFA